MARENKTIYAVLGLLMISPMSGYDMKKKIDMGLSFFWNENYGHLYPVLSKLEKQGLIAKDVNDVERRPERNVYKITRTGKQELAGWFPKKNDTVKFRSELMLKLFFGSHAEVNTLIFMVDQEKQQHEVLLRTYADLEKQILEENYRDEDRTFWHITLQNGRFFSQSQIAWCEETLKALKKIKLSPKKRKSIS